MNNTPDEFKPCQPENDGVCRLMHDHALHGGSKDWPVAPWYARLRRVSQGGGVPAFRGYDANYEE